MKISKHDALVLAKVLVRVVDPSQPDDEKSQLDVDLEDLAERVDVYLTDDGCSDHCEDPVCEDHSEEEEDLDDEEVEEEDEEEDDLDEEEDEDDGDRDEELEADCSVTPARLHDLKSLRSGSESVEFENRGGDSSANVIVDGYTEFTATHVRRKGKELHVRDVDGEWSVFPVNRYPAEWSATLPLNLLVGIER